MSKRKRPLKTPATIKSETDLCAMPRDNVTVGDYWMMVIERMGTANEFAVVLSQQKVGEMPTGTVTIPRKVFAQFVRWFQTGSLR